MKNYDYPEDNDRLIRVFLGPHSPCYEMCDEIVLSYETLNSLILDGCRLINTFQTWPLDFKKELKEKYGYEVVLMDEKIHVII